jgi:hypothetical protein
LHPNKPKNGSKENHFTFIIVNIRKQEKKKLRIKKNRKQRKIDNK